MTYRNTWNDKVVMFVATDNKYTNMIGRMSDNRVFTESSSTRGSGKIYNFNRPKLFEEYLTNNNNKPSNKETFKNKRRR